MSAFVVLLACLTAPQHELGARLTPLAKAHRGTVAIGVKEFKSGQTWFFNPDEVMPTASLIKLPVLIEAYLQAGEGKFKLSDTITLKDTDKVPGSGLLTYHFSAGTTFPLRDALHLMTAVSDNTATNLVLDRTGIAAVNQRMAAWGLKETRINAKVFRGSTTSVDAERTKKYGLGSTTAREMIRLLEILLIEDRVRPASKQAILNTLRKCDDRDKFPRYLKGKCEMAFKTGSVSDARTAAGILYLEAGPVALCVLTAKNQDRSWGSSNAGDLLCARVAREVHDYFSSLTRKDAKTNVTR